VKRGIRPESLPPDEDVQKIERRMKSQERRIAGQSEMITTGQKKHSTSKQQVNQVTGPYPGGQKKSG
jgi:hypothetical protein